MGDAASQPASQPAGLLLFVEQGKISRTFAPAHSFRAPSAARQHALRKIRYCSVPVAAIVAVISIAVHRSLHNMSAAPKIPSMKLSSGNPAIPVIGLGVYLSPPGPTTRNAVAEALKLGYRHVDTAQFYQNEADVGAAVRESRVPRSEIFVTTKVWTGEAAPNGDGKQFAIAAVKQSLAQTGLVLLHSPHFPKERLARWQGLEECQKQGLVKHIGVSNYGVHHLEELLAVCKVPVSCGSGVRVVALTSASSRP
jgi:hypothetical protein